MNARSLAGLGILALFGLVLAWQLLLSPPLRVPPWLAASMHAAPLLPALLLLLRKDRRAPFWGALAALILFCHGVSETWSSPSTRTLSLLEIGLSLLVIFGASWDGMRARFAKRRGV